MSGAILEPGVVVAAVGAATYTAGKQRGRRSKRRRRLPSACGKRSGRKGALVVSAGLVQILRR